MPKRRSPSRFSRLGIVVSLLLLVGLILFAWLHVGEARRFARLLEQAEPLWILLALAFQLGTYACAGAIWGRVTAAAGHRLPLSKLARLAVEKLSVDQFVPAGGMAGDVAVVRAMHRMGVPTAVATEALLIDIVSTYAAYAGVAAVALGVLWLHGDLTPVFVGVLALFSVLVAGIPAAIWWLLRHQQWRPGPRLSRVRLLTRLLGVLDKVSSERVWNPRLLAIAAVLQVGILLLDAATLWAALRAIGVHSHPLTDLVAIVLATIAGMLSLLPGGLGSFEAASTATLALLGVPVEAALTGTLLLRGMTLWIPLAPGVLLARRDLSRRAPAGGKSRPASSPAVTLGLLPGPSRPARCRSTVASMCSGAPRNARSFSPS